LGLQFGVVYGKIRHTTEYGYDWKRTFLWRITNNTKAAGQPYAGVVFIFFFRKEHFFMPQTKFQDFIYTVIMVPVMV
jgi:hypothetical protein